MADAVALEFLRALYPPTTPGHLVIWRRSDKVSRRFALPDLPAAVRYALTCDATTDAYFGCGLQKEAGGAGRGTEETVVAIPGLWVDVNVAGPHHQSAALPPNEKEAANLVLAVQQRPTAVVRTGGGLHCWWLFRAPLVLNTEAERRTAKTLVQRLQSAVIGAAAEREWKVDNTSDLARVLRLPGTFNHKHSAAAPVTLARFYPERRYAPGDFDDLPPLSVPTTTSPAYRLPVTGGATPNAEIDRRILAYLATLGTGMREGAGRNPVAYGFAAFLRRDMARDESATLMYLRMWNCRQAEPLGDNELAEIAKNGDRYGDRPIGSGLERERSGTTQPYRSLREAWDAHAIPDVSSGALRWRSTT